MRTRKTLNTNQTPAAATGKEDVNHPYMSMSAPTAGRHPARPNLPVAGPPLRQQWRSTQINKHGASRGHQYRNNYPGQGSRGARSRYYDYDFDQQNQQMWGPREMYEERQSNYPQGEL